MERIDGKLKLGNMEKGFEGAGGAGKMKELCKEMGVKYIIKSKVMIWLKREMVIAEENWLEEIKEESWRKVREDIVKLKHKEIMKEIRKSNVK